MQCTDVTGRPASPHETATPLSTASVSVFTWSKQEEPAIFGGDYNWVFSTLLAPYPSLAHEQSCH